MIFRGESRRIAEADVTPPAARRPLSASRRTGVAAAVGIAAFVAIGATSLTVASGAGATARTNILASSAGTHSGSSGLNHFGMAAPTLVWETAAVEASQLAAMKTAGITSVRFDADWSSVQPAGPTKFDWTAIDRVVKSARADGMSVLLTIDGCPPWAALVGTRGDAHPQPASAAQYATFAAEVAARYAPQGVGTFEIWNEPNSAIFWQPKPNPAAYTTDLVAAYAAIKRVDPSAFVISGGLAPEATDGTNISPVDFLKAMYADGAKGSFDALGYHPYSFPALPDTYEQWSGWSQMAQTNPSIRSVMTSNGDSGKSIWITEVGAPSSGPDGIGQAAQATLLTQAIAYAKKTTWVGALYIYSWQDNGTDATNDQDWFGLLTATGSRKPAYKAVVDAIRK
jgi:polysaccharide biosynthesis protein PslG